MNPINRLCGFLLIVAGLVLVVHTLAEPLYYTSTVTSPYSPLWLYVNWLTALGVVIGVIYSYGRTCQACRGESASAVTRDYLVANVQFYGFIVLGIMFFWNWFQLFDTGYTATTPGTQALVWILVDAGLPPLMVTLGLHLVRDIVRPFGCRLRPGTGKTLKGNRMMDDRIMRSIFRCLVKQLDKLSKKESLGIIPWSSPVPFFGDISTAKVATLGLNPSKYEFKDKNGEELVGKKKRLHDLSSLGLNSWLDATDEHLDKIAQGCRDYFSRNPYDRWFKVLDKVIVGAGVSYYSGSACHLDLVPFATEKSWSNLDKKGDEKNKKLLLSESKNTLGCLLRNSEINLIILNGQSVVDNLQNVSYRKGSRARFDSSKMPSWKRWDGSRYVPGTAYCGTIDQIDEVSIGRCVRVLGFNHNIQGSRGMTDKVRMAIKDWIAKKVK